MRELLSNLMKRGFDLLFHWTVAGIILAVWGFTPHPSPHLREPEGFGEDSVLA